MQAGAKNRPPRCALNLRSSVCNKLSGKDRKTRIGVHLHAGMRVSASSAGLIMKASRRQRGLPPPRHHLCVSVIFGEETVSEHTEFPTQQRRLPGGKRGLLVFVALFGRLVSSEAVSCCLHVPRVTGTRCRNISGTVKSRESVHKRIASPMKHDPLMETTQC